MNNSKYFYCKLKGLLIDEIVNMQSRKVEQQFNLF